MIRAMERADEVARWERVTQLDDSEKFKQQLLEDTALEEEVARKFG